MAMAGQARKQMAGCQRDQRVVGRQDRSQGRWPWRVVALSLTLLCVVPVVVRSTGYEQGVLAIAAVAATPYAVIVGGVATIVGVVARTPLLAALSLSACLVAAATQLPLFWADPVGEAGSDPPSLVVLTANVGGGAADPVQIMDAVVSARPDIVALQALSPAQVRALASLGMDRLLPYRFVDASVERAGSGLWSRTELRDAQTLPGFVWPQITARITVPRLGEVTVVSVHPVSPRPGLTSAVEPRAAAHRRVPDGPPRDGPCPRRLQRDIRPQGHARTAFSGLEDAADQAGGGTHADLGSVGSEFPRSLVGIDRVC